MIRGRRYFTLFSIKSLKPQVMNVHALHHSCVCLYVLHIGVGNVPYVCVCVCVLPVYPTSMKTSFFSFFFGGRSTVIERWWYRCELHWWSYHRRPVSRIIFYNTYKAFVTLVHNPQVLSTRNILNTS